MQLSEEMRAKKEQSDILPTLAREEMVPYKHMKNLCDLSLGSTHTFEAIGYIDHLWSTENSG